MKGAGWRTHHTVDNRIHECIMNHKSRQIKWKKRRELI